MRCEGEWAMRPAVTGHWWGEAPERPKRLIRVYRDSRAGLGQRARERFVLGKKTLQLLQYCITLLGGIED